jgi:hypothetical protein
MALLDQTSADAACAKALGVKNVLELHGLSIALTIALSLAPRTVIIAAP